MTRRAGGASGLAVLFVAGEAAQAFMNADGSAVVAGAHLTAGIRGVTLIAECLARIGADLDQPGAFEHLRQREAVERDVILLAAIEER